MPHPCLPLELERVIFIEALDDSPRDFTPLFLVAKRVRTWLVPFAFKVVVLIPEEEFFPCKFHRVSHFKEYGQYIHHLLITPCHAWPSISDNLDECLSYCPNIINLTIWDMSPSLKIKSLLNIPTLTRLWVDIDYLYDQIRISTQTGNQLITVFPKLTHLEIGGYLPDDFDIKANVLALARLFPSLTHIGFMAEILPNPDLFNSVLHHLKHLKALVWYDPSPWRRLFALREMPMGVDDDRVVLSNEAGREWEDIARGKVLGMWELVDEVLEEKGAT
ncbi:hypothetical protein BDN72DRAFT_964840 [Pluteus cervinus]|uniref:Uncharacterized protein n=1 Tax=Pluteus cervinus TaxID=181527 RepID=A0ACD3A8F3_9AGAR|nr:hypothetical protein BDN72DRAFT_964840 [Pluteus cervinus]